MGRGPPSRRQINFFQFGKNDRTFFRMSAFLLVIGSFLLAIALILTIAFLWIYLGHYTEISVKFQKAKYGGQRYFYKGTLSLVSFSYFFIEFDEDYDEAATRYRQVLKDYPGKVSCGLYENYVDLHREGAYRVGVLAEENEEPKSGYKVDLLPLQEISIWWVLKKSTKSWTFFSSEFDFSDPIQIRVGLKNCLAKMSSTAEEKEIQISTFYEVYESNCAHYTFCIKNWKFFTTCKCCTKTLKHCF